jgi:hypothetical protein
MYLLLPFIALVSITAAAQSGTRIAGRVMDAAGKPVINASVLLLSANDSAIVKTDITDRDGHFLLENIRRDTCMLKITSTGYRAFFSTAIIAAGRQEMIIPDILLLQADPGVLQEVVIISKKPFVQRTIDRTILNVGTVAATGNNMLDILEKAPGIQINPEGIISLRGKQGVIVFINDRPSNIPREQLGNYLKSLPAGSVESVEIMTNPPAKYDAAGNAGIINIKLRKVKLKGFNGYIGINYGQGRSYRSSNTANFNLRTGKFNIFMNMGYNNTQYSQQLDINRRFFSDAGALVSSFSQETGIIKKNRSASIRTGADYYVSPRSVLGIVVSGYSSPYDENKDNKATISDENGAQDSVIRAYSSLSQKWKNPGVNLNYNFKIDSLGTTLDINLDYVGYNVKATNSLVNQTYLPGGTLNSSGELLGNLPAKIDIKTAKMDFVLPFKKSFSMEAGLKASFIRTDNQSDFYDKSGATWLINNDFTNNFIYKENISAAYLNANKQYDKVVIQTGLRLEHTEINGYQSGNSARPDSSFKRVYTNLFPTVFLSFKTDSAGKNLFIVSYGRRIDRPNYQDMNPFIFPVDKFTYFAGNPFLQPSFSGNFEFSHTYKSWFTTSVQYSQSKQVINETVEQTSGIFIVRPGNIGKRQSWGASFNADIRSEKHKWVAMQWYAGYTFNHYTGLLYGQPLDEKAGSFLFSVNSQLQFGTLWTGDFFAGYETRTLAAQIRSDYNWVINAGIRRKILKEKGAVKLSFKDIFASIRPRGQIFSLRNSTATFNNFIDNRSVLLSFTWSFSKGKTLDVRQSGGADPEQNRVKTN